MSQRVLRSLLLASALGAGVLAGHGASPEPVLAVGPLPECRLDDVLTEPRGYDDWSTTLVDWNLSVGPDYKPPDRVSIRGAGVTGGGQVREVAFDDLQAMAAAARKAGVPLGSVSAYRSYKTQVKLFGIYASGYGFDEAVNFSARPGHSEHQLGLVIDFAAAGTTTFVSERSPTGAWLATNGWKYGWLMSYPKGKQSVTCYSYEPWHYRYVGRDLAKEIHDSGLTIREYLWASFTLLDPDCVAEPAPTVGPDPALRTCSAPAASAEPAATPETSAGAPSAATASPGPSLSVGGEASEAATPAPGAAGAPAESILGLDPPVAGLVGGIVALAVAYLLLRRGAGPAGRRR